MALACWNGFAQCLGLLCIKSHSGQVSESNADGRLVRGAAPVVGEMMTESCLQTRADRMRLAGWL